MLAGLVPAGYLGDLGLFLPEQLFQLHEFFLCLLVLALDRVLALLQLADLLLQFGYRPAIYTLLIADLPQFIYLALVSLRLLFPELGHSIEFLRQADDLLHLPGVLLLQETDNLLHLALSHAEIRPGVGSGLVGLEADAAQELLVGAGRVARVGVVGEAAGRLQEGVLLGLQVR